MRYLAATDGGLLGVVITEGNTWTILNPRNMGAVGLFPCSFGHNFGCEVVHRALWILSCPSDRNSQKKIEILNQGTHFF
jgi:hypothetical protein